MHGFLIEIIIIMHLRVAAERIRKLAVQHMVLIRLDRPLKSRMKVIRHLRGIKDPDILIAVQPTRGVDIGAIEFIHKQLIAERDAGKAVLLVSLELDEVMDVPDRILVMYEGEIVGEFKPEDVTMEDLGLYMTGAKRQEVTRK